MSLIIIREILVSSGSPFDVGQILSSTKFEINLHNIHILQNKNTKEKHFNL